jgi:hypothetical protein
VAGHSVSPPKSVSLDATKLIYFALGPVGFSTIVRFFQKTSLRGRLHSLILPSRFYIFILILKIPIFVSRSRLVFRSELRGTDETRAGHLAVSPMNGCLKLQDKRPENASPGYRTALFCL